MCCRGRADAVQPRAADGFLMRSSHALLVAFLAPATLLYTVFLLAPVSLFLAFGLMRYDAIQLFEPVLIVTSQAVI